MQPAVDALVERLLAAPELWPELVELDDRDRFADRAAALAAHWQLDLTADDVRAALAGNRHEWLRRWV